MSAEKKMIRKENMIPNRKKNENRSYREQIAAKITGVISGQTCFFRFGTIFIFGSYILLLTTNVGLVQKSSNIVK